MTHNEMRIRLAEAMGWTDIVVPGERPRMGEDVTGMPPEGHRPGYCTELPDPLESDRDAAQLRAWCVEQPWCGGLVVAIDRRAIEVTISDADGEPFDDTPHTVTRKGEPDPCRRERLALCRAALQAIEAQP